MESIEVRGTIRLGQFLKVADLAESGAHARALVEDRQVLVDGDVETRRGRQLHGGEIVEVDGLAVRVGAPDA